MNRSTGKVLAWSIGAVAALFAGWVGVLVASDLRDDCGAALERQEASLRAVGADLEPVLGSPDDVYCDDSGGPPPVLPFSTPPHGATFAGAGRQLVARGWSVSGPDDEGDVLYGKAIDGKDFTVVLVFGDEGNLAELSAVPVSFYD